MTTSGDLERLFDVRRQEWDPDDDDRHRPAERAWFNITHAEVHHLGDGQRHRPEDWPALLLGVEQGHENTKLWRDIFYNVVLEPTLGLLIEGRLWRLPSQDDVHDALTVVVAGDGRHDTLTPAAKSKLAQVNRLFAEPLTTHRERSKTLCPSAAYQTAVDIINAKSSTTAYPPSSSTHSFSEEITTMFVARDTTTGQAWVVANGTARILSDAAGFDFDGPVQSSSKMRHIIGDLYTVIKV